MVSAEKKKKCWNWKRGGQNNRVYLALKWGMDTWSAKPSLRVTKNKHLKEESLTAHLQVLMQHFSFLSVGFVYIASVYVGAIYVSNTIARRTCPGYGKKAKVALQEEPCLALELRHVDPFSTISSNRYLKATCM
jgi:hypothetical protein